MFFIDDFRDDLDLDFGSVNIKGSTFTASEILEKLDNDLFKSKYDEFVKDIFSSDSNLDNYSPDEISEFESYGLI